MEQPYQYKCLPHQSRNPELKRKDFNPANQITKRIRHEHYTSQPPYTVASQMNYPRGSYESWPPYSERQSSGPIYEHHASQRQDMGLHEQFSGEPCLDYTTEREYKVFESVGQQDVYQGGINHCSGSRGHQCSFAEYPGNCFVPKAGELARPIYDYDTTPFYQSTRLSGIIDPKVVNLLLSLICFPSLRLGFIA